METAGKQPEGDKLDASSQEGLRILARLIARRLMHADASAECLEAPSDVPVPAPQPQADPTKDNPASLPVRRGRRQKGV